MDKERKFFYLPMSYTPRSMTNTTSIILFQLLSIKSDQAKLLSVLLFSLVLLCV